MKTTMLIAALVSLFAGSALAAERQVQVAAYGTLHALQRAPEHADARYRGIERVRDSFRDGARSRAR
jgi:hypothetical protein